MKCRNAKIAILSQNTPKHTNLRIYQSNNTLIASITKQTLHKKNRTSMPPLNRKRQEQKPEDFKTQVNKTPSAGLFEGGIVTFIINVRVLRGGWVKTRATMEENVNVPVECTPK